MYCCGGEAMSCSTIYNVAASMVQWCSLSFYLFLKRLTVIIYVLISLIHKPCGVPVKSELLLCAQISRHPSEELCHSYLLYLLYIRKHAATRTRHLYVHAVLERLKTFDDIYKHKDMKFMSEITSKNTSVTFFTYKPSAVLSATASY